MNLLAHFGYALPYSLLTPASNANRKQYPC